MRILLIMVAAVVLLRSFSACKSSTPKSFCDSVCLNDTLKYIKADNPLQPFVYISAKNCVPDTLIWSYENMGSNRKIGFADLLGGKVSINKNFISCFIRDTLYAWLKFNDCSTGRGYLIKIPYSKAEKMSWKSSALNSFDPKFVIEDGLIAYSDRGNIFVEEEATGKQAMMTFGSRVEIDYDAIHQTVDSVVISHSQIHARVKMGDEWKVFDKNIEFK